MYELSELVSVRGAMPMWNLARNSEDKKIRYYAVKWLVASGILAYWLSCGFSLLALDCETRFKIMAADFFTPFVLQCEDPKLLLACLELAFYVSNNRKHSLLIISVFIKPSKY